MQIPRVIFLFGNGYVGTPNVSKSVYPFVRGPKLRRASGASRRAKAGDCEHRVKIRWGDGKYDVGGG